MKKTALSLITLALASGAAVAQTAAPAAPASTLSFNVGVEIGQIAALTVMVGLLRFTTTC